MPGVKRLALALLLLAAMPLVAQQPAAPAAPLPSITLPDTLDRVLRDYEKAWEGKDPAGLAALFTEDGFVMSAGKLPVRGREAIRAAYANAGGPLALRALAYSTDGNTGYIIGAYGGRDEKGDVGKFILAIRRVDGKWLIAADMDNSNRRPGSPG